MSKVGTFNYPGGKTNISEWIIQYIPEHEVYVEPFGGSAGVLANKPKSPLEVYNDTASLCVDFFRAVKHHPKELRHWVQTTPCSRELFNEYIKKLKQNKTDCLIERAGMFYFVQSNSFGGSGIVNTENPTFSIRTTPRSTNVNDAANSSAKTYLSQVKSFQDVVERFQNVQIESLDFAEVFKKYDSCKTVFYCDPPYIDVGDGYYQTEDSGFNHERFVELLHDLDGKWLVSYDHNIPTGLQDYTIIDRQKHSTMNHETAEKTESLVMNFDAEGERVMSELGQSGLNAYQ